MPNIKSGRELMDWAQALDCEEDSSGELVLFVQRFRVIHSGNGVLSDVRCRLILGRLSDQPRETEGTYSLPVSSMVTYAAPCEHDPYAMRVEAKTYHYDLPFNPKLVRNSPEVVAPVLPGTTDHQMVGVELIVGTDDVWSWFTKLGDDGFILCNELIRVLNSHRTRDFLDKVTTTTIQAHRARQLRQALPNLCAQLEAIRQLTGRDLIASSMYLSEALSKLKGAILASYAAIDEPYPDELLKRTERT